MVELRMDSVGAPVRLRDQDVVYGSESEPPTWLIDPLVTKLRVCATAADVSVEACLEGGAWCLDIRPIGGGTIHIGLRRILDRLAGVTEWDVGPWGVGIHGEYGIHPWKISIYYGGTAELMCGRVYSLRQDGRWSARGPLHRPTAWERELDFG